MSNSSRSEVRKINESGSGVAHKHVSKRAVSVRDCALVRGVDKSKPKNKSKSRCSAVAEKFSSAESSENSSDSEVLAENKSSFSVFKTAEPKSVAIANHSDNEKVCDKRSKSKIASRKSDSKVSSAKLPDQCSRCRKSFAYFESDPSMMSKVLPSTDVR